MEKTLLYMDKSIAKEKTYQFSLNIIKFCRTFPSERVFWVISDQLLRSAMSIGANIVEAKASSSKKDFINYFQIALKSANETDYWLNILKDSNLDIDQEKIQILIGSNEEICRIIGKSLLTMKKS